MSHRARRAVPLRCRQASVAKPIRAGAHLRLENDVVIDRHDKGSVRPVSNPLQQLRHRPILLRDMIPLAIADVINHSEDQRKIPFQPKVVDFPGHSIDVEPKIISSKILNRQTGFISNRASYRNQSGCLVKYGRVLRQQYRRNHEGK